MTQSQELTQYLLQAFDRQGSSINEIFPTVLVQFSDKLKYHLQAITHAEPIFETPAIDITEKIDEFKKLVNDINQFAQDIKPDFWLTYLSKSSKEKYQHCHDLQMLYIEMQPLLHFMSVIAQLMKDKIITPALSERLCSLLQQQQAINRKTTASENLHNHHVLNLHITKNSSSLANHLVATWKESRHNSYVLMSTLLKFFCEKKDGKITQSKQNIPTAVQEKQTNTSQFKL